MSSKPEPERLFRSRVSPAEALGSLLNIGPKSASWMEASGITSIEQVRRFGPVGVCRKLLQSGKPASLLLAYALEGALSGQHWNALPWETKQAIRSDFARMKQELKGAKRTKSR